MGGRSSQELTPTFRITDLSHLSLKGTTTQQTPRSPATPCSTHLAGVSPAEEKGLRDSQLQTSLAPELPQAHSVPRPLEERRSQQLTAPTCSGPGACTLLEARGRACAQAPPGHLPWVTSAGAPAPALWLLLLLQPHPGHKTNITTSDLSFLSFIFIIFLRFNLFMREKQRHRQREKQAPCGEPSVGLDPGTPGSHPEPRADTQPLSYPGVPVTSLWF